MATQLKKLAPLPILKVLPDDVLYWLLDENKPFPATLTLKKAASLYHHCPTPQLETVLAQTIRLSFQTAPEQTLTELLYSELNRLLKTPTVWWQALTTWLNSIDSISQIQSSNLLNKLDAWLNTANPAELPSATGGLEPKLPLAVELVTQYPNIAACLYSAATIEQIRQ